VIQLSLITLVLYCAIAGIVGFIAGYRLAARRIAKIASHAFVKGFKQAAQRPPNE